MADKHILRIHDTQANLLNDLKDTQIAWATDTEEAIWRDGNNFHFIGSGKYWDGSQFVFDNIDVGEVSFFDKTAGSILGKLTADGGNFTINFNGVDISIDASSLDLTSVTSVTANDPTLAQEVATKNYVDLNAVNIPTPAINGSFLVKNTNGTFTMLDGVSADSMRWDAINSKFLLAGTLDFTGTHNYKNGSVIKFLNASGVAQGRIIDSSSGNLLSISSDTTGLANRDLRLDSSADIVLQASSGKVDVQNDIEVAGDTTLTNLPTGTQVGLVGYDSAGKLIQGASSGGQVNSIASSDGNITIDATNPIIPNINLYKFANNKSATDTPSTYPDGYSYGLNAGSGGFPDTFGTHQTFKANNNSGYQTFTATNSSSQWIRMITSSNTWGSFVNITPGVDTLSDVLSEGNATGLNAINFSPFNNSSPTDGDLNQGTDDELVYTRSGRNMGLIGSDRAVSTITNINSLTLAGFYVTSNSGLTNIPLGWSINYLHVLVIRHEPTSGAITQVAYNVGESGSVGSKTAIRNSFNGGSTWTSWTELSLKVEASTNPSTMAVDSSVYKQISANNLSQTCTIPLPTNGVDGSKVIYRFRASATSTLSWNAGFRDLKGALPTSIAINKSLYVGVIYDAFTSTWDVVSVVEQN